MFSHFASEYLWPDDNDWETLPLIPECPTEEQFTLRRLNLQDPVQTLEHAIGQGVRGNLDFQIRQPAPLTTISIEWKGPKLFSVEDMAWVLLKLLTQPMDQQKVVAAIITSSATNRADHQAALGHHFNEALQFAQDTLQEQLPQNIEDWNLYGYVASIPDEGVVPLVWGQITGPVAIPG